MEHLKMCMAHKLSFVCENLQVTLFVDIKFKMHFFKITKKKKAKIFSKKKVFTEKGTITIS